MYLFVCIFFFFKQKTAYEMRISDWSSDVCSSDLNAAQRLACPLPAYGRFWRLLRHGRRASARDRKSFEAKSARANSLMPGRVRNSRTLTPQDVAFRHAAGFLGSLSLVPFLGTSGRTAERRVGKEGFSQLSSR